MKSTSCIYCGWTTHVSPAHIVSNDFKVWRCPGCQSLHSFHDMRIEDLPDGVPHHKRRLNIFNSQMFKGFYRFLLKQGLNQDKKLLFVGFNAAIFKKVFEGLGHKIVDIVENPFMNDQFDHKMPTDYDMVVIMEHFECCERPKELFAWGYQRLRSSGQLIIQTFDAQRVAFYPKENFCMRESYRFHCVSRLMLESLACFAGFRLKQLFYMNYMDTAWPFINYHAFQQLFYFGDNTAESLYGFKPKQFLNSIGVIPRYLFWAFWGGFFRYRGSFTAVFYK